MSQYDLAFASGVNRSYIGDLELGKRNPSLGTVERIALGLGVPAAELFREELSDGSRSPR